MTILQIIILIQIGIILTLFILSRDKYKEIVKEHGETFQFSFMAPVSLLIIDKLKVMERLAQKLTNIHHKIVTIYGSKNGYVYTKLFIAQAISSGVLFLFIFTIFGAINNDIVLFYFGLFLSIIIPVVVVRGLDKKVEKRQAEILIELPEFLNQIILLVNAGETVQKAIIRTVEKRNEPKESYLYKELLLSVNQLKNNESFQIVLEQFSKRMSIQEVSIFTTTILLNYRRGGDEFILALRSLSKDLWEKRKALARTLGEQASSKLVFPMVVIFIVVMIIIATPAIMLF